MHAIRATRRGEGRLGSIFGFIDPGRRWRYAAWHVVPAFVGRLQLRGQAARGARALNRYSHPDEHIMELIKTRRRAASASTSTSGRDGCKIMTLETSRTIDCKYERTIEILPGWKHTFHVHALGRPAADLVRPPK